jgi:tripartite-type tricarboxylate transporter receptor subunit TctC
VSIASVIADYSVFVVTKDSARINFDDVVGAFQDNPRSLKVADGSVRGSIEMGVYLVSFNVFDIQMMVFMAAIAVVLRLLEFSMAPLLLGFILGGMLEDNLRRAISVSDGQLNFLWERPTTLAIMLLVCLAILIPLARALRAYTRR